LSLLTSAATFQTEVTQAHLEKLKTLVAQPCGLTADSGIRAALVKQ
jgi:hypothetical protein